MTVPLYGDEFSVCKRVESEGQGTTRLGAIVSHRATGHRGLRWQTQNVHRGAPASPAARTDNVKGTHLAFAGLDAVGRKERMNAFAPCSSPPILRSP